MAPWSARSRLWCPLLPRSPPLKLQTGSACRRPAWKSGRQPIIIAVIDGIIDGTLIADMSMRTDANMSRCNRAHHIYEDQGSCSPNKVKPRDTGKQAAAAAGSCRCRRCCCNTRRVQAHQGKCSIWQDSFRTSRQDTRGRLHESGASRGMCKLKCGDRCANG